MLALGGENGARLNDFWAYRPAQDSWVPLEAEGPAPGALSGQTAVWDGSELLVYGGYSGPALHAYRPSLNRWVELSPAAPTPPPRGHHSAAWDPAGGQMLVFGGIGPSFELRDDIWAYRPSTNAWTRLDPGGPSPFPVFSHSAVWDADGGQMLVFGGIDPLTGRPIDELWAFQPSGSGWVPLRSDGPRPAARLSQSAVWDPTGSQMLMFGGSCGAGCFLQDVWAYRPAETLWIELPSVGQLPSGRAGHSAVWDPSGGLMLVLGGSGGPSALSDLWAYRPATYAWRSLARDRPAFLAFSHHRAAWDDAQAQMWVYDSVLQRLFAYRSTDNTWTDLVPEGPAPPPREEPSLVWDGQQQRLLLYGGYWVATFLNDLWSYQPGENLWTRLAPDGPDPPGRFRHAAVWADSGEMLVFGGYRADPLEDLWSFRPASNRWTQVFPGGGPWPAPRSDHAAAWDAADGLMLVFGGLRGDPLDDLWAYSPPARGWTRLAPTGNRPSRRFMATLVWDSKAGQALLMGGFGTYAPGDVWSYRTSEGGWARLAAPGSGSPVPGIHSAAWDPDAARVLLFTGYRGGVANDLWSFRPEADAWRQPLPSLSKPAPRQDASTAWDDRRREMIVFGGDGGNASLLNDLWCYRADLGTWMPLVPTGRAPEPRRNATVVWDSRYDRLLLFGGTGARGPLGDTWAYQRRTNRWEQLGAPGPAPPARTEAAAAWDPEHDQMLMFGGTQGAAGLNDLWGFDSATNSWTLLAPGGPEPAARFRHTAIWDSARQRMLIFAGYGGGFPGGYLNDLWAYDPAAGRWGAITPDGAAPPSRARHSAVWDGSGQRMLVFGGYAGGIDYRHDLWAYEDDLGAWEPVAPRTEPTPHAGHVAVKDPKGPMLVFGGGASAVSNELWAYRD